MELCEQQGHDETMKRKRGKQKPTGHWILGAVLLAVGAGVWLTLDNRNLQGLMASLSGQDYASPERCVEEVQPRSLLSRAELSQFIKLPTPSPKTRVLQLLQEPFCRLPALDSGQEVLDREAYPLEFDPQVWLVVQYRRGEYVGYEFSFREEFARSR